MKNSRQKKQMLRNKDKLRVMERNKRVEGKETVEETAEETAEAAVAEAEAGVGRKNWSK